MNLTALIEIGLPVAGFAAAGWGLPHLFVPRDCRSFRRLGIAALVSVLLLLVAGGVVFALLYARETPLTGKALVATPLWALGYFLNRSALAVLIWGPFLLMACYSLARRIDGTRARDQVRATRGKGG